MVKIVKTSLTKIREKQTENTHISFFYNPDRKCFSLGDNPADKITNWPYGVPWSKTSQRLAS